MKHSPGERFSEAGLGLLWGRAPIYRLGGQDRPLPDRGLCRLCLAPRARLHRPGARSAEGLGGRSPRPMCRRNAASPPIPRLPVPFSWVAADSVYRVGDLEMALRRAGKGYVPGVSAKHAFHSWHQPHAVAGTAKDIAADLLPEAWRRLAAGSASRGERLHDWLISKWPISMPRISARSSARPGHEAC